MPSEEDQSSRPAWMQSQPPAFSSAIHSWGIAKARVQYHSRSEKQTIARKPQGNSLCNRALGSADHVLRLAFHPEVRRMVGKVGNQRDELRFRHRLPNAL